VASKPWNTLLPIEQPNLDHDERFVKILNDHGFGEDMAPVPLQGRYSKPRRRATSELDWAFRQWEAGVAMNHISAALNRNPQDMIYKFQIECPRTHLVSL
jgi:hypothetical protein